MEGQKGEMYVKATWSAHKVCRALGPTDLATDLHLIGFSCIGVYFQWLRNIKKPPPQHPHYARYHLGAACELCRASARSILATAADNGSMCNVPRPSKAISSPRTPPLLLYYMLELYALYAAVVLIRPAHRQTHRTAATAATPVS